MRTSIPHALLAGIVLLCGAGCAHQALAADIDELTRLVDQLEQRVVQTTNELDKTHQQLLSLLPPADDYAFVLCFEDPLASANPDLVMKGRDERDTKFSPLTGGFPYNYNPDIEEPYGMPDIYGSRQALIDMLAAAGNGLTIDASAYPVESKYTWVGGREYCIHYFSIDDTSEGGSWDFDYAGDEYDLLIGVFTKQPR